MKTPLSSLITPISHISLKLPISQRGFIKLTKSALVSYLIISTVFLSTGFIYLFNPFGTKEADAAWFNGNWGFRKEVPITANAAADTNAFFSFSLDTATLITAGQLQSSCQDIRVTDVNGNILPYHIGRTNACNNAATTIDALAPYAPNSATPTLIAGASTFYVYYGNPSVTSKDQGAFSQSEAASYTVGTLGTAASAPSSTADWKFNEGVDNTCSGGTNDACNSGNGGKTLDAAQSGMTTPSATSGWQTEDQCISGKCLRFDGSDDIVTASGFANDFFTGSWTQSFWIKTTQTGNKVITEKGSNNAFIQINDGQVRAGTTTTGGDYFDTTGAPLVNDGNWHYVVAAYNGTSNFLITYIDGVGRGSLTLGNDAASSATAYSIGARVGPTVLFAGTLDELKVYNFTESAAQVLADYNARSNPEGVSQQQGNNIQNMPQALSQGIVGYWKLDESSSTAADSSGYGLTLTNNNTVAYASGKFGNAASFTAASSMYLSTATTISGVKTVSFWTYNASTTDEYINLTASAYITSSSGTVSATGFTSPTIYVNGVINGTLTASVWNHVVITTTTGINANAFEVGRANAAYNNGKIDDVRTYNRALSASDIAQLYNWAPGPVGYWKMDEGAWTRDCSTTSVTDSSGNGNNGKSCPSTTGPITGNGKYGRGGSFDGTDDYVDIAANTTMNNASFSAGGWFKPNVLQVQQFITKNSYANSWRLFMGDSSGDLEFDAKADTINLQSTATVDRLAVNQWTHVFVTFDSVSLVMKIYVNGRLTASQTASGDIGGASNTNIIIGATDNGSPANLFSGSIDDIKLYNYARSTSQVVEDMNAGHPAPGSPVGTPIGYWKLNEGYGTAANNSGSGGTGIAGTITGSPSWTEAGQFGKGLVFDETNNKYVSISGAGVLQDVTDSSFTFSAWAKPTSTPNNTGLSDGVAAVMGRVGFHDYIGYTPTQNFKMEIWNAASSATYAATSTSTYATGTWHHLVGVVDVTNSLIKLYVDGVLQGSASITAGLRDYGTADYYIGKINTTSCASNFTWCFDGSIDEVKIYNSALSADQVKEDYNRGATQVLGALSDNSSYQKQAANQEYCVPGDSTSCAAPVGRWDIEEGSGTTAQDSSGNANTGTITAGTGSYTKGKIGKGYLFDGADTLINAGSGTTLDNLPAAGMSLEGWIYPTGNGEGSAGFIVAKNNGNTQNAGWLFLTLNTGGSTKALQFTVDGSTDLAVTTADNSITFNTWNHIALSWDGVITTASSVHIYVNGKETTYSNQTNGAARVDDAASSFYIGNASSSDRTFAGTIDAVRVFNYARTPAQIAWDYNKGGPVGWWKMDECQGTTINDSSGNSLTGTLNIGGSGTYTTPGTCVVSSASSAWYNGATGKRNYSMAFDHTDDYIAVSDNDKLDLTTSMSISAWIKPASIPGACGDFSDVRTIFNKGRDTTTTYSYNLEIDCTGSPNIAGTLNFALYDGSSNPQAYGTRVFSTGTWYHVVGTYDGVTLKVYVNGLVDGSQATAVNPGAQTSPAAIGKNANASNRYFDGQIDDVRVYNYPLTAAQVKTVYNQGVANYGPTTGAP